MFTKHEVDRICLFIFVYFLRAGTKNTNICRPHLKCGTHVSLYSQYARWLSGNIEVVSSSIRSKRHFHQQESRPVNQPFVCQTEGSLSLQDMFSKSELIFVDTFHAVTTCSHHTGSICLSQPRTFSA